VLFSGNFFMATVFGMLVGLGVGFFVGLPISLMATLYGILSGIMGGMMGALLGKMIVAPYEDAMVKIMFFLSLRTLLMTLRLINEKANQTSPLLCHPLIPIAFFGLFFILFELFGPIFS